jgi:hypothetical protein
VRFEDGMIVELVEFRDSVTLLEMRGDTEIGVGEQCTKSVSDIN